MGKWLIMINIERVASMSSLKILLERLDRKNES